MSVHTVKIVRKSYDWVAIRPEYRQLVRKENKVKRKRSKDNGDKLITLYGKMNLPFSWTATEDCVFEKNSNPGG